MEKPLQISTISFDGDMTLWDFRKVMRHSLKHTLAELQRQRPTPRILKLTINEMIAIREQFAEEVKGKVWNLEEIRLGAFERTLDYVGCPDKALAAHLNAIYRKHRFEDIELYPDVIPTFDVLAPHFKLGCSQMEIPTQNAVDLRDISPLLYFPKMYRLRNRIDESLKSPLSERVVNSHRCFM